MRFAIGTVWRSRVRKVVRLFIGLGLIAHGLGHAVLPLRGAGVLERYEVTRIIMTVAWSVALVGFAATGLGILGVRGLRGIWPLLFGFSILASLVAIFGFRRGHWVAGALIDALAIILVYGGAPETAAPAAEEHVLSFGRNRR